jgi:hypothetical protein
MYASHEIIILNCFFRHCHCHGHFNVGRVGPQTSPFSEHDPVPEHLTMNVYNRSERKDPRILNLDT